jgi:hypothetical protein
MSAKLLALIAIFTANVLPAAPVFDIGIHASGQSAALFGTNCIEFATPPDIRLVPFGPPYGTNPLVNIPAMVATNGLVCLMNAASGDVYVINNATNDLTCLRMPATNICKIELLDKLGHAVKKTNFGEMFGLPLSQVQIDEWRRHWNKFNESVFIRLFPNGIPAFADTPTEICSIPVKDAFVISEAGEYEFHAQLRFIQVGQDGSGQKYYLVTLLPEIVVKVQIPPKK